MRDYEDYENDIKDIKNICFLYELRHLTNIFGGSTVAKELKCSFKRVEKLYDSNIHGSKSISFIKNKDDNYFDKEYQKLLDEQEEYEYNMEEIRHKQYELQQCLMDLRKNALGIGTNKLKRRLNKLSINSSIAKVLRLAIEIEDCNIRAKDSYGKYRDKIYAVKKNLIEELIVVCKENDYIFGKQNSDVRSTNYIIYFELPNCEQISFHTDFTKPELIPDYEKEWDKKENSTYPKLIKSIEINFPDITKDK